MSTVAVTTAGAGGIFSCIWVLQGLYSVQDGYVPLPKRTPDPRA